MFKHVPGNHKFLISLSGEFKSIEPTECTPEVHNGKVDIELFGVNTIVDVGWLSLMAWYEVELKGKKLHDYMCVKFVHVSDPRFKLPLGMKMCFQRRLMFAPGYAIVPNFVRYAVNIYGSVIDTHTGQPAAVYTHIGGYVSAEIYDPLKNYKRAIGVHRLVALAWVGNSLPTERHYVNHIDGIKTNNYYKNLEWCTQKENNIHAVYCGLNTQNCKVRLRIIKTGEIHTFPSIARLFEFIKSGSAKQVDYFKRRRASNPFMGKYEIRVDGDDRPWYFIGENATSKAGFYVVDVTYEDGQTKRFTDVRDFIKDHKLWNISTTIKGLAAILLERRPTLKIVITGEPPPAKETQALDLRTGEVTNRSSMSMLSRTLGISKGRIITGLRKSEVCKVEKFLVRYKSEKPWPAVAELITSHPRCILGVNKELGKVCEFPSLRAAARETKMDKATIKVKLLSGEEFLGWSFSEKELIEC